MLSDQLHILACQIDIPSMTTGAERDRHLLRVRAEVDARLQQRPADLVVLPELSSIDYSRPAFAALEELGEPLDGASFQVWREIAIKHDCHVVFGFARRGEGAEHGRHFISMGVVGPKGELVGHYDKIYLAQFGASMEKDYFERGTEPFSFEVKGFRVAPIICADIRIPELSRHLTLEHGAELILHCGAYARDETFATWHDFSKTRAIENQLFFLSLNRAGKMFGDSLFCLPWMDDTTPPVAFSDHSEEFKHVLVARQVLETARNTYSFLQDRLTSL
ncbi:(R)-stereoselective amidase [Aliiroseovarius sp. xm-m-379]|uniref:carbon-nitrogen hydrolase family protein n=1 Tax=unclassified Aliiroseovarius TaxID=2623558 RepID=UPI0019DC9888|nr:MULTISPECIES: carbon-nitrogen hydrolase family protein [unclassified Aliiroseovarius]NRP13097.1 (R)-stereoselective amidase [Aliiroseovarius sp. xm-d-517]NRP24070.1 (R)-stereoselective amidase [Aliiroseovarius sp. xm-m-379]NRP30119.1 (R)-stereoselective amidase [Aliiroseovarius sp. xm-m-314]NRP32869.1 (R)-stereoselective amidase [Aliiroseovarius sp. xm-a-104]NRP40428.1 (R)-stereoselective amidase [Aliiroseovarius sp. xm-m-339-2]